MALEQLQGGILACAVSEKLAMKRMRAMEMHSAIAMMSHKAAVRRRKRRCAAAAYKHVL